MQELSGNMTISTFIEATIIPHTKTAGGSTSPARYYRAMTLSEAPASLKPSQLPATASQSFYLSTYSSSGEEMGITGRVITKVVHNEHLEHYLRAVFNRTVEDDQRLLALYHQANPSNVHVVKEAYTLPTGVTPHDTVCAFLNETANTESPTPATWAELVRKFHDLLSPAAVKSVECPGLLERACHDPAYDHVPGMLGMCPWLDGKQ